MTCESERGMAIMEVGAPLQKMLRPPVAAARSGGTRAGTRESSRRTPTELGSKIVSEEPEVSRPDRPRRKAQVEEHDGSTPIHLLIF